MARHGVLRIPAEIIDPVNRNIAAVNSGMQVIAYNKKLLAPDKLPNAWEGFWPRLCGNSFLRYPCLKNFFHNCLITNDLKAAKAWLPPLSCL
jgi:hypothetical protein